MSQLSEAAREIARRAADAAKETTHRATVAAKDAAGVVGDVVKEVTNSAKDAAHRATDTAKDIYQSAAVKAEDTLENSKDYVRQNPVLVVAGAIAFGAAIGCMLMLARRQPTLRERYVDEPLDSARDAILAALAPVVQRLQEGYDSARDGAGKAMDRVHHIHPGRAVDCLSRQVGRAGSNLRFW